MTSFPKLGSGNYSEEDQKVLSDGRRRILITGGISGGLLYAGLRIVTFRRPKSMLRRTPGVIGAVIFGLGCGVATVPYSIGKILELENSNMARDTRKHLKAGGWTDEMINSLIPKAEEARGTGEYLSKKNKYGDDVS